MSDDSPNVQVIRKLYAAMGHPELEGLFDLMTPEVEFVVPGIEGMGAAGTWRGEEQVRECMRRLREGQENLSLEFLNFVAQGSQLVVRLHARARVLSTGNVFESQIIHFFELADGRVSKLVDFFDTAAVLRAYGTSFTSGG